MSDSLYEPSTQVRLSSIFSVDGADTDPTTVQLKVRDPAGAVTTYDYPATVTKDSTGHFHHDVVPVTIGRWYYRWIGTGAVIASVERTFRVRRTVIP